MQSIQSAEMNYKIEERLYDYLQRFKRKYTNEKGDEKKENEELQIWAKDLEIWATDLENFDPLEGISLWEDRFKNSVKDYFPFCHNRWLEPIFRLVQEVWHLNWWFHSKLKKGIPINNLTGSARYECGLKPIHSHYNVLVDVFELIPNEIERTSIKMNDYQQLLNFSFNNPTIKEFSLHSVENNPFYKNIIKTEINALHSKLSKVKNSGKVKYDRAFKIINDNLWLLKDVTPPIIDFQNNYLLSERKKSSIAGFIDCLRKDHTLLPDKEVATILNDLIPGLNFAKDGRILRNAETKEQKEYIRKFNNLLSKDHH